MYRFSDSYKTGIIIIMIIYMNLYILGIDAVVFITNFATQREIDKVYQTHITR